MVILYVKFLLGRVLYTHLRFQILVIFFQFSIKSAMINLQYLYLDTKLYL